MHLLLFCAPSQVFLGKGRLFMREIGFSRRLRLRLLQWFEEKLFMGESLSGLEELIQYSFMQSLEPLYLRRRQTRLGELEGCEEVQGLSRLEQAGFEINALGRERGCRLTLLPDHGERRSQKLLFLGLGVSHAKGFDEGQGLGVLEPMGFDAVAQGLLLWWAEAGEGVSEGDADGAGVDALGDGVGQTLCHGQSGVDPLRFFLAGLSDGLWP
jgi:hypothetical protein